MRGAHLDRSCEQMSVVRQAGRERRAVVEGVLGAAFRELQARLERVNLPPVLDDLFLLLREAEGARD